MKKKFSVLIGVLALILAVSFAFGVTIPIKECNVAAKAAKANCRNVYEEGSDAFVACIHQVNVMQGLCKESLTDDDGDGVPNGFDNCPMTYNPDQQDLNKNGIGDACESIIGQCITNRGGYNDCLNQGHVLTNDPDCPSWKYRDCIKYNYNFTCGLSQYQDCEYSPDTYQISTSRCVTGWACPKSYTLYDDNQICIYAGGTPVPDSLCLVTETACELYLVNLRCI